MSTRLSAEEAAIQVSLGQDIVYTINGDKRTVPASPALEFFIRVIDAMDRKEPVFLESTPWKS